MSHAVKIGGREILISWNLETSRRFNFRLSNIGGHPTKRELTTPATASAAVCKLLWALLPSSEIGRYATPEDLFVAIDEEDSERNAAALLAIYADMTPTAQKKMNSKKSPSQESNSE